MNSLSRLFFPKAVTFVICAVFAMGCLGGDKENSAKKEKQKTAATTTRETTHTRPVLKASLDDCVGPVKLSSKPKIITFADHKFKVDGYLLTQLDKDPDSELVVGIISDTKEKTEKNLENIDKIVEFFKKEKADVIVHLGDIASVLPVPEEIDVPQKDAQGKPLSAADKRLYRRRVVSKSRREAMAKSLEDIVEVISVLAESDLPVLAIIGNRECKTTFNSAMTTLSEDYPNVFSLDKIRRADLDDLDIISMPGYHDPEYVHCTWDKCLYYESDTLTLVDLAREANDPVMLVSHGPPRQKDRNGIDVVSEGANVGNPWLTNAIVKASIPFGAFGNIQEAGGKATNLDGTEIIPQDKYVDSLYLNPGPADSMSWSMNDGTESIGMAAVIHVVGKKAKYKIFRIGQAGKIPQPTVPEKTEEEKPAP
jgi:Icc-related predicted phosphoesterase